MVKKAFNFLILLLIERKYYYYLSVGICKFLFLFVDVCCCSFRKSCIGTLLYMFVPGLGGSCQMCVQEVIFGTCMADEICDSGLFDSIEEVFKEKLDILGAAGEKLAGWLADLLNLVIGECK